MKKIESFCSVFYVVTVAIVFAALAKSNIKIDSVTWWICLIGISIAYINGFVNGKCDSEYDEENEDD